MKKTIILIILLFTLTGCSKVIEKEDNINTEELKEEYIDNNPITLSLYINDNVLKKINDYSSKWRIKQDIGVFTSVLTNEEKLEGYYFQDIWEKYCKEYNNIDTYKIGYHINFKLKNNTILEKTILSPKDSLYFYGYISIYLYDDYHQEKGKWYRHIEEDEVFDNTIFTSIKITAEEKINDIDSTITLTAFTYDNDDFDENNNYRGKSKYTITIENQ